MPAYNAAQHLPWVLAPLASLGKDWEVIVVDDASQDGTLERLQHSFPWVKAIAAPSNGGQSRARNLGVRQAQGQFLFFVDSDVVTSAETLKAMAAFLEERPELDGVFGCYSAWGYRDEPPLSRFRNLLHRYVHQRGRGPIQSFWSGLGAMRKSSFEVCGGFDEGLQGIEDVELGKRMSDHGARLFLEPAFEGRHLKCWSWRSMIVTDVLVRAKPWAYLALHGKTPRQGLNLSPANSLGPLLLCAALLCLCVQPNLVASLMSLYFLCNLGRYAYFGRQASLQLGVLSSVYLLVHHLCCLVGAALGVCQYFFERLTRKSPPNARLPEQQQGSENQLLAPRESAHSIA